MTDPRATVAILVFPDVEILDFAGPYEVLAMSETFDVFLVAETADLVRCRGGLVVKPDHAIDDCPPFDVLLVPGGPGARRLAAEGGTLVDWLGAAAPTAATTAGVCTGSLVLSRAGLLEGRAATTHWASLDRLAENPAVRVRRGVRVVDDGAVVTSAGVSAGIDLALHLVERQAGADRARLVAERIEYPWTPTASTAS